MQPLYVRMMNKLYWICIGIAIVCICTTVSLIFIGTMARDLFGIGAMYSEQLSIMFAVQMTFYGAAACYRAHAHLSLLAFVSMLSKRNQAIVERLIEGLFVLISAGMVWWGIELVQTTMFQRYAEVPWEWLKVGYIYSAVPISGLCTLLFVIEQIFYKEARDFHSDGKFGEETDVDIIRRAHEERG